jgi:hypothetical protein
MTLVERNLAFSFLYMKNRGGKNRGISVKCLGLTYLFTGSLFETKTIFAKLFHIRFTIKSIEKKKFFNLTDSLILAAGSGVGTVIVGTGISSAKNFKSS